MKKKIYFKEEYDPKAQSWTLFWKTRRWLPFRKVEGKFNYAQKRTLMLNYVLEYDAYIWDSIYGEYLPVDRYY